MLKGWMKRKSIILGSAIVPDERNKTENLFFSKYNSKSLLLKINRTKYSVPPSVLVRMIEFSLFNSGFNLHHDIWRDWVHFMGSFCVFCNFSHQLSIGGSRGLKPTVLSKTYKRWHFLHQCVIILCLFMFFVIPVYPNHLQREGGDLQAATGT